MYCVRVADALWDALHESNQALAKALGRLSELCDADPSGYATVVRNLSSLQSREVRPGFYALENSGIRLHTTRSC